MDVVDCFRGCTSFIFFYFEAFEVAGNPPSLHAIVAGTCGKWRVGRVSFACACIRYLSYVISSTLFNDHKIRGGILVVLPTSRKSCAPSRKG